MQVLKARGNINQHRHRLGLSQREGLCQRASLSLGHDQEQGIAGIRRVDDWQEHVTSALDDSLADLDLTAQKALIKRPLRALLRDHLDCHAGPVRRFGGVNAAEAPGRAERPGFQYRHVLPD